MIRIQTTYNYGCESVERVVEVDDIATLTSEEREQLIGLATGPLTFEIEEEDDPGLFIQGVKSETTLAESSICGKLSVPEIPPYPSYTQNLVAHGLFEKNFRMKSKIDFINVFGNIDGYESYVLTVAESLMEDMGFELVIGEAKAQPNIIQRKGECNEQPTN